MIVDDEKPARERLRHLLRRDGRVTLVSACGGGAEPLEAIRDAQRAGQPVQLLFLDVQMPELDGFAVLSGLVRDCDAESMPATIFVTAYDEYALREFEAHAIDYLLKPFSDERFQAALDRAIRYVRAGDHTCWCPDSRRCWARPLRDLRWVMRCPLRAPCRVALSIGSS